MRFAAVLVLSSICFHSSVLSETLSGYMLEASSDTWEVTVKQTRTYNGAQDTTALLSEDQVLHKNPNQLQQVLPQFKKYTGADSDSTDLLPTRIGRQTAPPKPEPTPAPVDTLNSVICTVGGVIVTFVGTSCSTSSANKNPSMTNYLDLPKTEPTRVNSISVIQPTILPALN